MHKWCESWWLCECVCAGKETWRKQTLQSSVKCQNQQAEGGWWFTERRRRRLLALCGLLWDLIHVTERNGGYFNQQATVERCPTACESFKTYCFYTSVGLERIPMWTEEEEEEEEGVVKKMQWLFQFRNSKSNNPRQFYINRGTFCDQWFNLQPVHESFHICGLNTQCLVALSQEKPSVCSKMRHEVCLACLE